MYHTEGYLDKNTYFAKGHIWGNAIVHQGNICYVWCVAASEKEAERADSVEETDSMVRQWVHQELVVALGKGQVSIQKEVNRFGAFMKKKLYLYYKGHFFAGGDNNLWRCIAKGVGVYASLTVSRLPEFEQLIQSGNVTSEQMGNLLKTAMLGAMSEGRLEQGFFLLWEDDNAF